MGKNVSSGEKIMGLCVSDRQPLIIYHIKIAVKSREIVRNPKTNLIKLWPLWPIFTSRPLKCYSASIYILLNKVFIGHSYLFFGKDEKESMKSNKIHT